METNRIKKYSRISTAQADEGVSLYDMSAKAIGQIGKLVDSYKPDKEGKDVFDKAIQINTDLAKENMKARALFESMGLGSKFDDFANKLDSLSSDEGQKFVQRQRIPELLNVVAQGATASMAPIEPIFELASKIYLTTPDINLVKQTLDTIGEFESKMPGISFWEDALKAANRQDYQDLYNMKKLAVIGVDGAKNFGEFNKLDIAIGYAKSPGSKSDQRAMKQLRSDEATKRSTEISVMITADMLMLYKQKQNLANQKLQKFYQDNFSKIADTVMWDFWMRFLMGIGVAHAGQNLLSGLFNPAAAQGFFKASGRNADQIKNNIRLAQAPQDIRPPESGAPVNSTENASSGSAGTESSSATGGVPAETTGTAPTNPVGNSPANATGAANETGAANAEQQEIDNVIKGIQSYQELLKKKENIDYLNIAYGSLKKAISSSLFQSNQSGSLSNSVLGESNSANVPMADANKITYLSQEAKEFVGEIFKLAGEIPQLIEQVLSDPKYLAEQAKNSNAYRVMKASISKFKIDSMSIQESIRNDLVTFEENIRLAGLFTQISALSILESELQATYDAVKLNSPYASQPAAEQYRSVLNQLSELYYQLAIGYAEMYNSASMDEMKRAFASKAKLFLAKSQMKSQTAIQVRNESYFGMKSASAAPYLFNKTAEKIHKDSDREADARIREYFDSLFEDTPGSPDVGTVLDNPAPYRGVLTTDVGKRSKYRRHRSRPAQKAC